MEVSLLRRDVCFTLKADFNGRDCDVRKCQKRTAGPLFEKRKSLQPFRIGARSQMFGAPSQDLLASVD